MTIYHEGLVDALHRIQELEDDLEAIYEVTDPEQYERKTRSQVFLVQQEKGIAH